MRVQTVPLPLAIVERLPGDWLTQPFTLVWLDLEMQAPDALRRQLQTLVPVAHRRDDLEGIWQWLEGLQTAIEQHHAPSAPVVVLLGTLPLPSQSWAARRVHWLCRDLQRRGVALRFQCIDIKPHAAPRNWLQRLTQGVRL